MFKKADKSELRTWLLGDIILFAIGLVVLIACVGGMASSNEFKVGTLVFALIGLGVSILAFLFLLNIIKALKTFDQRKESKEKAEKEKQKEEDALLEQKLKEEQAEMAELRRKEEEMRRQNLEEIEKAKLEKEKLEAENKEEK